MSATSAANFVRDHLMHRHRGCLNLDDKLIVFGNDGYSKDERSQREVEIVRKAIQAERVTSEEFALDDKEGYSWALVILCYDKSAEEIQELEMLLEFQVWEAWDQACEEKATTAAA